MKHSVLFITDNYLPFPSSNGMCVSRLVEYYKEDVSVYVLSFANNKACKPSSNEFYCEYNRKPSTIKNRIFSFCEDTGAVEVLYKNAVDIIEKYMIDTVVCVYRPVECVLAGLQIKKKYQDKICVLGYMLDNIAELNASLKIKNYILNYNQKRMLKKFEKYYDGLVVLRYYESTLRKMKCKREKIRYVGLPALKKLPVTDVKESHAEIKMVYAGSFYPDCRRPDEILQFLSEVCNYLPNLKIHLYSWGCEEIVNEAKLYMDDALVLHGRVSASEAEDAIRNADILLNIGNDLPYAIPGKLFEYFATGKSILNFCYRKNDGSTEDCLKYGNIFNVYSKMENSVEDCIKFIEQRHQLPWETVRKMFSESLPQYTIEQIEMFREGWKNV